MGDFEKELANLLNRHSKENDSDTPDWILAQFMAGCLAAFNTAVLQHEYSDVIRSHRLAERPER